MMMMREEAFLSIFQAKMAASEMLTTIKNKMTVYCKHLQETISSLEKETAGDGEKAVVLAVYQEKCRNICEDIDNDDSKVISDAALCKFLQTIAQLVLDLTFVEENSLIDQEFPQSSSLCSVRNIIETLQSVDNLTDSVVQDKSIIDVLSSEIVECLYWRKGALLYMYCHTLNSQYSIDKMPSHYSQCLEDGVKFLTSMLCTRSSPNWLTNKLGTEMNKSSDPEEDDEDSLFTQGILSDTHLLALMYCGEMCYWHTQLKSLAEMFKLSKHSESNGTKITSLDKNILQDFFEVDKNTYSDSNDSLIDSESQQSNIRETKDISDTVVSNISAGGAVSSTDGIKNTIDIVKVGQLCLENYVKAAQGPMLIGGWKTTRAEEILQYLDNLKL